MQRPELTTKLENARKLLAKDYYYNSACKEQKAASEDLTEVIIYLKDLEAEIKYLKKEGGKALLPLLQKELDLGHLIVHIPGLNLMADITSIKISHDNTIYFDTDKIEEIPFKKPGDN